MSRPLSWAAPAALALLASAWVAPQSAAPAWHLQSTSSTAGLRGLSVVSDKVVWASGTAGTFLLTTDGGDHWTAAQVPGAERQDFRDVKAFSPSVAYLLAIAATGGIYKTTDAGAHWTRQYTNPGVDGFFLDDMAFWDADHGLAIGDPTGGHFLLLHTEDGGAHWIPAANPPAAQDGDGVFAASGTSLVVRGKSDAWFATGGTAGAHVFHSRDGGVTWTSAIAPLASTPPSSGAGVFSLAFWDALHGVAVGGDYRKATLATNNLALTADGGQTWTVPAGPPPGGYRSGVAAAIGSPGPTLIAVGTSGSDWSMDGGKTWAPLGTEGFNSVAFASPHLAFAADGHGHIASLVLP